MLFNFIRDCKKKFVAVYATFSQYLNVTLPSCNAIKYLYRWKRKNGIEDIKKAKWYIDKFLDLEQSKCPKE